MLNQKDGDRETVADQLNGFHQLACFRGVHTGSRLVEQQNLRRRRQSAGDLELPLLAVGQIFRFGLCMLLQIKDRQQIHRAFGHGTLFLPVGGKAQNPRQSGIFHLVVHRYSHVVQNRNILKQANVLEGTGNSAAGHIVGLFADDAFPLELNGAFRGLIYLRQQVKYGRLTGAVRADQTHDLIFFQLEIDIFQGAQAAKRNSQMLRFEQRHPLRPLFSA